ncbi:MAG: hypothetical protein IJX66_00185 [Lachnospiraceae bacterium]|nr:hypothetical protein [Lachnospiraceae bacterium]
MKKKIILFLSVIALSVLLTGCGEDPKQSKFEQDIQTFCDEIAAIDANINNIDASSETATYELLAYLDQLDQSFQVLAQMSIPEEYAYLEELTTDASSYMTTAVASYHDAFEGETYDAAVAEYARENYERAYKRITVMLKLLRGEDITGDGVVIEETVAK